MFIERRDGTDAVVGQRAKDLDDGFLVSARTRDGVMEFLGVEVGEGGHQRDDDVLEVSTKLALQFTD